MVAYFLFYFWSDRPFFPFCKSELIGAIIVLSEGRKSCTEGGNGSDAENSTAHNGCSKPTKLRHHTSSRLAT